MIYCACGAEAEMLSMDNIVEGSDLGCYYVYCSSCGKSGPTSISAPIALWYWEYDKQSIKGGVL